MSLLTMDRVSVRVDGSRVVREASLSISGGEVVALVGPNGAGKTSLMKAALGLLPLVGGVARLGGDSVAALKPEERGRRVAWLPQDRRPAWNMPAVEVAALGAAFLSGEAALARAHAALDRLDADALSDRGVASMSGGERARVMLARVLASAAPLLVLDEPMADLDPDAQLMVGQVLRARASEGAGVFASLHDLNLAARIADRVVVMGGSRIVADGPPTEALRPQVLAEVFGLDAIWVDGRDGPLLDARRG